MFERNVFSEARERYSISEIMKKLDDIIETKHAIISMLELCEKESEEINYD